jgi:PAS domain S-box-containing protein
MDRDAYDQSATAEVDRAVMHALTGPQATPLWALMDRAPVGVFVLDSGGECTYVNERASELAGLAAEQCLGEGIASVLHPDDLVRVRSAWHAAAERAEGWSTAFRFQDPHGSVRWVDGAGSAIHDADGRLAGWLTIAVDLTEIRRTQQRLENERGERAALLVRMLHAAEHERMLMAIELHDGPIKHLASFGYTLDRVSRRLIAGEVEKGIELLHGVRGDLTREVETLRRMMAELRPPVLDERGLEAALREYSADFEERTRIRCTFLGSLGPLRFDADAETVLYRVTQEALGNVHKHAEAKAVRIELGERQGLVALAISDDGVGFDAVTPGGDAPEDHYGLLSLHERVDGVGGHARVLSNSRFGTRVEVTVPQGREISPAPVLRPGPDEDAAGDQSAGAPTIPPRVVVVDDQEAVRRVLVALLQDDGFDVVAEGADGAQAIRLVDELGPELVLMDIRMPVMSGRLAAAKIAERRPQTRVVLLSGSDDPETLMPSPDDGVFDMVPKSGDAGRLCQTLRRALKDGQAGGPP